MIATSLEANVAQFEHVLARVFELITEPAVRTQAGNIVAISELTSLGIKQANHRIERRTWRRGPHAFGDSLLRAETA